MDRPKRLSKAQLAYIVDGPNRTRIPEAESAVALRDEALKEIRRLGYRVVFKRIRSGAKTHPVVREWAASTSVIGRKVFVGLGFRYHKPAAQAVTLWHELVHCRQQVELGLLFYFRYVRRTWRAVFEAEATVTEILAWQQTSGRVILASQVIGMIEAMHSFYRLTKLDRAAFVDDVSGSVMSALLIARRNKGS